MDLRRAGLGRKYHGSDKRFQVGRSIEKCRGTGTKRRCAQGGNRVHFVINAYDGVKVGRLCVGARWSSQKEHILAMILQRRIHPGRISLFISYFPIYLYILPFVCFSSYHCRKSPQNGIGSTCTKPAIKASSRPLLQSQPHFLKLPAVHLALRHASP